jgi:DNA (cytosine-5)-methyltransferase 1
MSASRHFKRPVAIDLFSGAGGISLGLEQAGFDVAAAVEVDPVHAAVHEFNFPHNTVIARSVVGLSGSEIRRISGIGSREVALVAGGAPCQGFSMIGQRQLEDPRNHLVAEFVRLVCELEARTFLFENVKGLTLGNHRRFLEELIAAFERAGYMVRAPWSVLDARRFGVPQKRERLILLGARAGTALPNYPSPTHCPDGTARDLPRTPTCAEALDDLPDAEEFTELLEADEVTIKRWRKCSSYAASLRCTSDEDWHFGLRRKWNPRLLTCSLRAAHTDLSRRRFQRTEPGTVEPISRFFRLPPDGYSNTLRAGTDSARGAFTSPRPIHHRLPRCITVREMARLHGFPDWFRLHATKWHGARQIGNAVAPPLARALGREIMLALGVKPQTVLREIALGDPRLLQMEVTAAADYFGIANPIAPRLLRRSESVRVSR